MVRGRFPAKMDRGRFPALGHEMRDDQRPQGPTEQNMAMTVEPSDKPAGAIIRGVDFAAGIDDACFARIRDALHQHAMICLRGQTLTPQQQVAFTRRLGPLQPYAPGGPFRLPDAPDVQLISNIYVNGAPIGIIEAGQYWHTDASYSASPPAYACLYAVEIPHDAAGEALGGTIFVNTSYAYETLPGDVKQRILGLRALHSRDHRQFSATRSRQKNEYDAPGQELDQPMVRTHPVTGRKCLYVNPTYTVKVLGMPDEEGAALLKMLHEHMIREETRYTHRWEAGDFVILDDCGVQHHAIGDYSLSQRRLIRRTAVDGTRPV